MPKLNDEAVKKIVLQVQEFAQKSGLESFMEPFEVKPSAWREMAMLVIEDNYTAKQLYEALNPNIWESSSPYTIHFPRTEYDSKTKKNTDKSTTLGVHPYPIPAVPWDFVSFDSNEDDYCKFAIVKNCYRLFVGLLKSGVKLYV